jgi:hypothetical protein
MEKGICTGVRVLTAVQSALAIVALWTAAASIEITVPLWGKLILMMGNIQPLPTAWVIESARLHVAWWIAGLGSLFISVLWLRRSRICAGVSITALFVSTMGASLAALALSLPIYPCGPNAPNSTGLGSCDKPSPLMTVKNASGIPGLYDRINGMLGQHIFLDNLPDDARSVEAGHSYLISKATSGVKRRHFYPSYHQKRMEKFSEWSSHVSNGNR